MTGGVSSLLPAKGRLRNACSETFGVACHPIPRHGSPVLAWPGCGLSAEAIESPSRLNQSHDAYTLGLGRDLEPLLANAYQSQVFRPQGWISAVVLVGGYMQGVWEHKIRRSQTIVKVHMFSSATASVRKGIEVEAERLSAFLDTKVVLEVEDH